MKVLLVRVPIAYETFDLKPFTFLEPLALEYLGAGIQDNHDVRLLDMRADNQPSLKKVLESFQPDIMGCSAFTSDVYQVKEACESAKKYLPGIMTVVGGHHAAAMPEDFFEDYIDVVATAEGVHPFKKICDYHETKKSFEDIENIYCRKNGKMTFTRKESFPDLDSLPFPARSLTAGVRHQYKTRLALRPMRVAFTRSSTGCYFNCKFCGVPAKLERKLYRRSIDKVVEELEAIEEPFIIWADDEFFLDHQRAVQLAREIGKSGIKKQYFIESRVDTIIKHPECIEEWAKIGLKTVFVGLESHLDKDLKVMQKGTDIEKNREAINVIKKNNVLARGGFIVQPYYEKEDFDRLVDFYKELAPDFGAFTVYTPLPGTQLWEEMEDKLITRNYNLFDIAHTVLPTTLPLKEFYKEFASLGNRTMSSENKKKFFEGTTITESGKFLWRISKAYMSYKKAHKYY